MLVGIIKIVYLTHYLSYVSLRIITFVHLIFLLLANLLHVSDVVLEVVPGSASSLGKSGDWELLKSDDNKVYYLINFFLYSVNFVFLNHFEKSCRTFSFLSVFFI